jgi:hypoxanthine phosphoribosyltransferase
MHDHIDQVLLTRQQIADRVSDLARTIAADLRSHTGQAQPQLTIVAVLTGSLIFLADLIRDMPLLLRIRLITVSSYPGSATTSQGVRLIGQLPTSLAGEHVLVVDDILDSGQTIRFVRQQLAALGPASIRTCMLLRKQRPTAMAEPTDYIGFDIPDTFVVGYGLDYDGFYRNLPQICTLKPHVIQEPHTP